MAIFSWTKLCVSLPTTLTWQCVYHLNSSAILPIESVTVRCCMCFELSFSIKCIVRRVGRMRVVGCVEGIQRRNKERQRDRQKEGKEKRKEIVQSVWHAATFPQMAAIGNSIKNRNKLTIELINQTVFWARLGQLSFHVFFHWVSLTNTTNNKHNNIVAMITCDVCDACRARERHMFTLLSRTSRDSAHSPKQLSDSRFTVQTVLLFPGAVYPHITPTRLGHASSR